MANRKRKQDSSPTDVTPDITRKKLPVEFVFPENPPTVYANHMTVQTDGRVMFLSFFMARPPLMLGSPEEMQEKLDGIQSVQAHMVVQVLVPVDRMPAILKVLNNTADPSQQLAKLLSADKLDDEE